MRWFLWYFISLFVLSVISGIMTTFWYRPRYRADWTPMQWKIEEGEATFLEKLFTVVLYSFVSAARWPLMILSAIIAPIIDFIGN